MAEAHSAVTYTIQLGGLGLGLPIRFDSDPSGDGWTDQLAIEVAQALSTVNWPNSCPFGGIQRIETDTSITTIDLTANPPVFH